MCIFKSSVAINQLYSLLGHHFLILTAYFCSYTFSTYFDCLFSRWHPARQVPNFSLPAPENCGEFIISVPLLQTMGMKGSDWNHTYGYYLWVLVTVVTVAMTLTNKTA